MGGIDERTPATTAAPATPAFTAERSFVVGIFGDGLYSVGDKMCKTATAMLDAVKAECGIGGRPRSKAKPPGGT